MADILIRGMEMPTKKNGAILIIYPNGKCAFEDGQQYEAVELPEHGDLIDRSELQNTVMQVITKLPTDNIAAIWHLDLVNALLRGATVIVPAEREEEENNG